MITTPWRIRLLGELSAERDGVVIRRFKTRKVGGLLAYLAHYPGVSQPRDILIERLWPELDVVGARACLSTTLTCLRRHLEPPCITPGTVLRTTRLDVCLNAEAVVTDHAEFLAAVEAARKGARAEQSVRQLRAIDAYNGVLVPGYYEDWVISERDRLESIYVSLVKEVVRALVARGERDQALERALHAARICPDRDELRVAVVRLYRATGREREAVAAFKAYEKRLRSTWGGQPSPELVASVAGLGVPIRLRRRERIRRGGLPPGRPMDRASGAAGQEAPPDSRPRLPLYLTRFFGREKEIATLAGLLGTDGAPPIPGIAHPSRLITLTGPPGSGKTRLAIEAVRDIGSFGDKGAHSAVFVGLAEIGEPGEPGDPDRIMSTILAAFGRDRENRSPFEDQLAAALGPETSCLLILDNAEQLVESLADLLPRMLARCPDLRILATSRMPLGIPGERLFPVAALDIPERTGTPERLLEFACVGMFVDRAQAASPGFQITSGNANAIVALCQKLEGIPLAIELAAARIVALTPAQMLDELRDRFRFLISRQRTIEVRHKTLFAAIEWSCALLDPSTRRFFLRAYVFRGSFDLEAARIVGRDPHDPPDYPDPLDHLERLVQRSLLLAEESAHGMRYRMLESIREFAQSTIAAPERQAAHDRLADYLAGLAERESGRLRGPEAGEALGAVAAEMESIRVVVETFRSTERCLRIAGLLWRFWGQLGHAVEAQRWLQDILAANPQADPVLRSRALTGLASILRQTSDYPAARDAAAQSLELAERARETLCRAEALNVLGVIEGEMGEWDAALERLGEAANICIQIGEDWLRAAVLNNISRIQRSQGMVGNAADTARDSRDLFLRAGDENQAAVVIMNLGVIYDELGDFGAARGAYEHSLRLARALGRHWDIAILLHNLGEAMYRECRHPDACRYLLESIRARHELGDHSGIAYPVASLANVAADEGDLIRAAMLHGAASALRRSHSVRLTPGAYSTTREDIAAIRYRMRPEDFAAAWRQGETLSLSEIMRLSTDSDFASRDRPKTYAIVSPSSLIHA